MVTLLLAIASLSFLFLAILTYQSQKKSLDNRIFAAISILFAMWSFGILWFMISKSSLQIAISSKIFYIAATWFGPLLTFFTIHYPKNRIIPKILIWLGLFSAISLSVAIAVIDNFILNIDNWSGNRSAVPISTLGYSIFAVHFVVFFFLAMCISIYKFLYYKGQDRNRASLYIFGIVLTSLPGFVVDLIMPFQGNYSLIWIGPLASTVFLITTGYSIIRHRMFDIRAFLVRALVYTLTSLVIALLYIAPTIYIFSLIFDIPVQPIRFLIATLLGLLVASNFESLRSWFDRVSARFFFREAYDPASLVGELNKTLVNTIDVQQLLGRSAEILDKYFRPEFCHFLLKSGVQDKKGRLVSGAGKVLDERSIRLVNHLTEKEMPEDVLRIDKLPEESKQKQLLRDADLGIILRLRTSSAKEDSSVGYLLVGVRKSGKPYEETDLHVLMAVSDALIIAIQNALHYEEIQQFNVTLQGKVEDATRKLRATNEKLKQLDETKDEFISMASHQLRTPLTSIKGYLSMVLEGDAGKLNVQQTDMLKQSFMSSQRMVNLIADLLNLSRLNTGKFVIQNMPTDLRTVVDQEVSLLKEAAEAKDIKLSFVMPKTFAVLPLDETKIHQVVMNFIDNAIYYTPPGGRVDVVLQETPTQVEFRVHDTGIGVPREVQRHLFTKFYRADNAKRARPDGTGLGLFMAKKVIAAQGGSVIFESVEGKGSTFGFRFTKKALQAQEQTTQDTAQIAGEAASKR